MFGGVIFVVASQPWYWHYGTSTSTIVPEPICANQLLHHREHWDEANTPRSWLLHGSKTIPELNWNTVVSKRIFQNTPFTFCAKIDKSCRKKLQVKLKQVAKSYSTIVPEPICANQLLHHRKPELGTANLNSIAQPQIPQNSNRWSATANPQVCGTFAVIFCTSANDFSLPQTWTANFFHFFAWFDK